MIWHMRGADYKVFLIPIFLIYLFFALVLLTKDPSPYTDEVAFSNAAYRILHGSEFGKEPFKNRLTLVDPQIFALYGPTYILLLSVPLKLFGYSIYSVRLFSVCIGLGSLFLLYLIIQRLTQNSILALLGVFLLGVDMNFLRIVRFGRPEVLVIFFVLLSFYYYLTNINTFSYKKYLVLSFILSANLLTHYLLGLIGILTIFIHSFLVTKNKKSYMKKFFFLAVPIILGVIVWLIVSGRLVDKQTLKISKTLLFNRILPNFFILRVIIRDRLTYNGLTFIFYLLSIIIYQKFALQHQKIKTFWILAAIMGSFIVLWGSVFFYAGLLPVFFLPLLIFSLQSQKNTSKLKINLPLILVGSLFLLSVFQQMRLWSYYRNYSYKTIGKKTSDCIPKGNHNVLLTHAMPDDPYFYLVSHRTKLKLAYTDFHDAGKFYLREYLPKADFAVVYGGYADVVERKLTDVQVKQVGLEPLMAQILLQHTRLTCTVFSETEQSPKIAVFKIQ